MKIFDLIKIAASSQKYINQRIRQGGVVLEKMLIL